MKSRLVRWCVTFVPVIFLIPVSLPAAPLPPDSSRPDFADDQAFAGKWVGTYTSDEGGTGKVAFTLSLDDKGQWRGSVAYTNQDGDQMAEIKALQLSGSKFKGTLETPSGAEITLEGEFQDGRFSGTYVVRGKGSTEVAEKGTWKTSKS